MRIFILLIICSLFGYACGDNCGEDAEQFSGGMCVYSQGKSTYAPTLKIADIVDEFSSEFHVDMPRLLSRHGVKVKYKNKIDREGAIGIYDPTTKVIEIKRFGGEWTELQVLTHELLHFLEDVFDVPEDESVKHINQEYFGDLKSLEFVIFMKVYRAYNPPDSKQSNLELAPVD